MRGREGSWNHANRPQGGGGKRRRRGLHPGAARTHQGARTKRRSPPDTLRSGKGHRRCMARVRRHLQFSLITLAGLRFVPCLQMGNEGAQADHAIAKPRLGVQGREIVDQRLVHRLVNHARVVHARLVSPERVSATEHFFVGPRKWPDSCRYPSLSLRTCVPFGRFTAPP